jgi:putative DNA primase/helicase
MAEYAEGRNSKPADPTLSKKLRAEYPGILAWAVEGSQMWLKNGLEFPTEIKEANANYRGEMDALADFLAERCVVNPNVKVIAIDHWKDFITFLEQQNDRKISKMTFFAMLRERGYIDKRGHSNKIYWHGISLLSQADEQSELELENDVVTSLTPNLESNPENQKVTRTFEQSNQDLVSLD